MNENIIKQSFGDTLRELRAEKGMSQEVLANLSGVARQTISKFECCDEGPSLRTFLFLAGSFDMSFGEFAAAFESRLERYEQSNMKVAEEFSKVRKASRKAKDVQHLCEISNLDKIKRCGSPPNSGLLKQSFGDTLRELRAEKGMSQEALANLSGIARQTISKFECCNEEPSLRILIFLAGSFDMSLAAFVAAFEERLERYGQSNMKVAEELSRARKASRKTQNERPLYEVND